jgi:hypothetical protein
MVVNEGEVDLFLNFACSCQQHDIRTTNILVFAGSLEMVCIYNIISKFDLFIFKFNCNRCRW